MFVVTGQNVVITTNEVATARLFHSVEYCVI